MKKRILLVISFLIFYSFTPFASTGELAPLRASMENLGFQVEWNNGAIQLTKEELNLNLSVGSDVIQVHDKEYRMDGGVVTVGELSYLPADGIDLIESIVLYDRAVIDAATAEQDEILPIITIPEDTEEVIVGTWHKYPDSYQDGTDAAAKYGEVWVFTQDEILDFARENNLGPDPVRRFEQLIGLPPEKGYTHFSFLKVAAKDLVRPAFQTDIYQEDMTLTLDADGDFAEWFHENADYSYENNRYPWTPHRAFAPGPRFLGERFHHALCFRGSHSAACEPPARLLTQAAIQHR